MVWPSEEEGETRKKLSREKQTASSLETCDLHSHFPIIAPRQLHMCALPFDWFSGCSVLFATRVITLVLVSKHTI